MSLPLHLRKRSLDAGSYDDRDWLRDRGVRIDEKGRIIVSLPPPDDDVDVRNDDEASIVELMRRDAAHRKGGSRGRRRRSPPKASLGATQRSLKYGISPARIGRPCIGVETRISVQTTISRQTREALEKHQVTLADVLNDCARELTDGL